MSNDVLPIGTPVKFVREGIDEGTGTIAGYWNAVPDNFVGNWFGTVYEHVPFPYTVKRDDGEGEKGGHSLFHRAELTVVEQSIAA